MKIIKKLQVVVETTEYLKQAESCMDKKSRDDFISHIAQNPMQGDLIPGTGGARFAGKQIVIRAKVVAPELYTSHH